MKMDTGMGKMAPISETVAKELKEEKHEFFSVGEIVELKGSKFRVHAIRPKKLILKILPR